MPSHETHRRIRHLLGLKGYGYVDRYKDAPFKVLGRRHRILRHDLLTNLLLAVETGDPRAFLAGELHDLADQSFKLKRRRR
jgi:hypothetical protein